MDFTFTRPCWEGVNEKEWIEKVTNAQIEFWVQVNNQFPDLNLLHTFSNNIYDSTKEAEDYWKKLSEINPNYCKALNLYGNYMLEIKNHSRAAFELLEKYFSL